MTAVRAAAPLRRSDPGLEARTWSVLSVRRLSRTHPNQTAQPAHAPGESTMKMETLADVDQALLAAKAG